MKWLGLTGGLGCGKSTALKVFKELGFGVVSADDVVHSLYKSPELIKSVCDNLGISVENFSLQNLSKIVFADEEKLRALEAVIHPRVRVEVQKIREAFEEQGLKASVYEVPLLFEKSMESLFDFTLCIGASEEVQLKRIKARNDWSDSEIEARLNAQLPLSEKKKRADFYIDNSGSLEELKQACKQVLEKINL